MPRVGYALQPDASDLALLAPLLEDDVDYYEVAPETLWREDPHGDLQPNGFHAAFLELGARTGRPFVAHGVGLSLGTVAADDAVRRARWHERIRRDHHLFRFEWYSDHLGATVLAGEYATLPMPVPMTDTMAEVIHDHLRALQEIVPLVAIENSVVYHQLGDARDEPAFLGRILRSPGMHLVLDLHNVVTMAANIGLDADAYVAALDLSKVIEIHLAGGTRSDPRWLPHGRTLRLDSHCSPIPAEVWRLFEQALPHCPNLRGVTLERMEGTVERSDVAPLRDELRRIRAVLASAT